MTPAIKQLISKYKKIRSKIKRRVLEFRRFCNCKDERIFEELCFCLFTPQAKAFSCDRAIGELKKRNLLLEGNGHAIKKCIKGLVRFHNKKAKYLVGARKTFFLNCLKGKGTVAIKGKDPFEAREWLVKNVKGLGYKEASHFLRNIGLGKGFAILDVHILKNLKRCGVIREIPAALTKKIYLDIEDRMRWFSKEIGIPLEELDLLFWANETGFVFK